MAPKRPCRVAGCPALVTAGYCWRHGGGGSRWSDPRRLEPPRIRGAKLQAMRARLFQQQPVCELCERGGVGVVATIRDHRIPLAEGGTEDESNVQALCANCHAIKTAAEAKRGRVRE